MAKRKRKSKKSSIHVCAFSGDLEGVIRLLEDGQNVHDEDKEGHPPLSLAVLGGHVDVVEYLLEAGADANRRDASGFNALHSCLMSGTSMSTKDRLKMLKLLVASGADVNAQSHHAGHPLEIAKNYRRSKQISDYLKKMGAEL